MTNKQIIDGVDVSGCIHYEEYFEEDEDVKIKDFCALWYNSCHSCNNCNCNYKLWQRAEQKLAKIEETIELAKEEGCRGCAYAKTDECFVCYETENKILEIIEGKANE